MKHSTKTSYITLDDEGILIERECTSCTKIFSREHFYSAKSGPGGYMTRCRKCHIETNNESRRKRKRAGRARERLNPELSLRAHNEKMLSKSSSGEFKISDVKSRMRSPGIIIQEAHPGEHIVCLRKRIQGENQIVLLEMSMDGDTLHEMMMHNHWKMTERVSDVDVELSQKITHIENIRRLPFNVQSLKAMLSSHTYYLWMDNPRPLTRDEISDVYDIPKSSLEFILAPNILSSPPRGDIYGDDNAKPEV